MTQINGLGFNPNYPSKINKKEEEIAEKKEQQASGAESKQVSPDKVLDYLSNTSLPLNINKASAKTIDVSKYVTPEQAERIGGFINSFEGAVVENLKTMDKELGFLPEYSKMSDQAKLSAATSAFAAANMPE